MSKVNTLPICIFVHERASLRKDNGLLLKKCQQSEEHRFIDDVIKSGIEEGMQVTFNA